MTVYCVRVNKCARFIARARPSILRIFLPAGAGRRAEFSLAHPSPPPLLAPLSATGVGQYFLHKILGVWKTMAEEQDARLSCSSSQPESHPYRPIFGQYEEHCHSLAASRRCQSVAAAAFLLPSCERYFTRTGNPRVLGRALGAALQQLASACASPLTTDIWLCAPSSLSRWQCRRRQACCFRRSHSPRRSRHAAHPAWRSSCPKTQSARSLSWCARFARGQHSQPWSLTPRE